MSHSIATRRLRQLLTAALVLVGAAATIATSPGYNPPPSAQLTAEPFDGEEGLTVGIWLDEASLVRNDAVRVQGRLLTEEHPGAVLVTSPVIPDLEPTAGETMDDLETGHATTFEVIVPLSELCLPVRGCNTSVRIDSELPGRGALYLRVEGARLDGSDPGCYEDGGCHVTLVATP